MSAASIDIRTAIEREKLAYEADPIGLIRAGYLEIRDKSAGMVKLVANSTQEKIISIVQSRRRAGRPAFLFVLKARQLGVSTIAEAIGYCFTSQRPNLNALVIADDIDGASYIFKMNELFYDRMKINHPHLTPVKSRSDERRLEFQDIYSRMMIDTANNSSAGRKFTLQFVHCSEVAFFRDFSGLMQSLRPAISDSPDTIVIFETTANGINDVSKFYWKIKAAFDADPDGVDWIPLFCSWKDHAEYSRAFHNDAFKEKFLASLSPKEKEIQKTHGLTLEQLNWRRHMIEDAFAEDDEKFEVEFPLTDKEAFKSTSRQVFPARLTDPQKKNISKEKFRGEIEMVDRRPSFVPDERGFLKIYQECQPEERYVMAMDACESALTHDMACASVFKRSTWAQVAHLHGHMNPEDFAERSLALGYYYNRALLCPERNGPGLVVVTYLANRHYPNICRQEKSVVSDDGVWSKTEEYGFHTNVKTKPFIIDQLQNSLRTLLIVIHDKITLEQLESYVVKQVNKDGHAEMGAEEGFYDEDVMTCAIANHYLLQLPSMVQGQVPTRQFHPTSRTGY